MIRFAQRRSSRFSLDPRRLPALALVLAAVTSACRTTAPTPVPASPATAGPVATAPARAPGTTGQLVLGPIDASWVSSGAAVAAPKPGAPPRVVLEVIVAPAARLVADLDILGRKLPMRFGDLVVDALTKNTADNPYAVNAELLAALAPDRAVGMVMAQRTAASDYSKCLALPFVRAADAIKRADQIGATLSDRGGATERRHSSGAHVWTAIKDDALLLSESYDGLVATCAQALAATRAPLPSQDAIATVNLEAIFAAQGDRRDLSAELGDALAKAADESAAKSAATAVKKGGKPEGKPGGKKGTNPAAAGPRLSSESMRRLGQQLGRALAESARARLAIAATPGDGLVLSAALEPKPGTALARRATGGVGYALDPALPIADDRAAVFSWGSLGAFEPLVRASLASGEGAAKSPHASTLDEFLAVFTGGGSCVMDNDGGPLATACSLSLRAGADARQALDRYLALVRAMSKVDPSAANHRFSPRIKNDILEFDWRVDLGALPPEQVGMMRSLVGGDVTKYAVAVRGGRLLQFQGPTARARLLAWKDVAPGGPAPARPALLADALARTGGDSFVLWLDPLAIVLKMLAHATDPSSRQVRIMLSALPGLATTRTPVVVDAPAGPRFSAELRVPTATFDNVAGLIGPFMGLMGR